MLSSTFFWPPQETQGALAEFPAHRHSLAALAWWRGGDLIASASRQGTIIRVHTAAGTPVCAVRRGSLGASVYGLSFCVEQENGAQVLRSHGHPHCSTNILAGPIRQPHGVTGCGCYS